MAATLDRLGSCWLAASVLPSCVWHPARSFSEVGCTVVPCALFVGRGVTQLEQLLVGVVLLRHKYICIYKLHSLFHF